MTKEEYMRLAISLAAKGEGRVSPNPLVGAVLVKDGRIIGEGYHEQYGGLHAERNAFAHCMEDAEGATLYVTLEPCCHYGKTPPCTEAIIEHKIKKVVVGIMDPNPLVAGKGLKILNDAGIETEVGILENKCRKQNEIFLHYIKHKIPFVTMKYAMTMDGKIATAAGESKWITGEEARANVQQTRNRHMGIMVGVGTVLADNPQLTCRIEGGRNPVRIICDTHLRTPLTANVVETAKEARTILATCCDDENKQQKYLDAGCEIVKTTEEAGHVNLKELMQVLGQKGIDSILLEGGSEMNFAALKAGIVTKVQAYVAPKLFGGQGAKTPVGGEGFLQIPDSVKLTNVKTTCIGEDILIEGEVASCSQES